MEQKLAMAKSPMSSPMSTTMDSRVTQGSALIVMKLTCVYYMKEVCGNRRYDEIGTGVKASKPSALATSVGACELTESTHSVVRSVATFEIG